MAADTFDPSTYNRPPILNAATGFALAKALIAAMPKGAPDMIRRSAKLVRDHTVELQSAWIAQDNAPKEEDRRRTDLWIDSAWSALAGRIDSYCLLPKDTHPLVVRAQQVRDHLIGQEGLAFLNTAYDVEWAESDKRIRKIEELGLAKDIDKIAGKEFLENLLAAHDVYGKVVGTTEAKTGVTKASLAGPLRNLQVAIGRYARQWAAAAEDSDELTAKARTALAPIDRLRERQASGGASSDDSELSPSTPVPDLPEKPPTG
jgi:hypothetical protein